MRLDDEQESVHVEDRRGKSRSMAGRGIGIGTIALALLAMYFGIDPSVVLNVSQRLEQNAPQTQPSAAPPETEQTIFVKKVLANTERTWQGIFKASGGEYQPPTLVLFEGNTKTYCGTGLSAMGPFYCPADQKIYIDLSFYDELKHKFQATGDFAQGYVIAHEVGHHVQNLVGISDKVQRARQQAGSEAEANQLSVRLELQADCYAGVWAAYAGMENRLEDGDIEEALNAAAVIGDDALQKKAQGYAVPDSFTHGSSAQRMRWLKKGLSTGDIQECDTFSVTNP
jgi:predicted metalloprotease